MFISYNYKKKIDGNFKIKRIKENLIRKKYLDLIKNSDIVLLPYDKKKYFFRTSGIFFESIQFEKIIFVTKKTWIANKLLDYKLKELIVDDWSNFNIKDHYQKIDQNKVNMRLRKMKKDLSKFHNSKVFKKKLSLVCGRK